MKSKQQGFGRVVALLILLVVAGLGVAGWALYKSRPSTGAFGAANSQNSLAAVTIKGVVVQPSDYYSLQLATAANSTAIKQYFGKVQKIGSSYVRLYPAYYADSAGKLVLLGKELYAPEPAMYIRTDKIAAVAKLSDSDTHLQAIKTNQMSNPVPAVQDVVPANAIDTYIKPADYQAIFFDDGNAFFGKLHSVRSGQLFINNSQIFGLSQSGSQINLGKIPVSEVANYNNSQVIFWENMTSNSRVSQAINTYLKQNP